MATTTLSLLLAKVSMLWFQACLNLDCHFVNLTMLSTISLGVNKIISILNHIFWSLYIIRIMTLTLWSACLIIHNNDSMYSESRSCSASQTCMNLDWPTISQYCKPSEHPPLLFSGRLVRWYAGSPCLLLSQWLCSLYQREVRHPMLCFWHIIIIMHCYYCSMSRCSVYTI